jgi:hypothetical protein
MNTNCKTFFARALLLGAAIALTISKLSFADTVGLYRFDTIGDSTDTPGGEYFLDSSGNNLTLTNPWSSYAANISSDKPSIAPNGSLAVVNVAPVTPVTNLFSLGNTGQLTIEFWYKPQIAESRYIAGQSNANNAWLMYQKDPVAGKVAIEFYARKNNGAIVTIATPALFDAASGWNHVALTVDGTGVGRFFRNGIEVASSSGFTGFAPHNSSMILGAQPSTGGFANQFLIDDFRVSNVALPAATGNGDGQLAWNTSLSQGLSTVARPADFGKEWIRQHPFMISSWLSTAEVDDLPYFKQANMTASMGGWYQSHDDFGIEQHYLGAPSLDDAVRKQMHIANNLPNLTGWLVGDEILPGEIAGAAQAADYIRSIDPDGIIYAGMGSSDPAYITQVVQAVKPDALIHGYYPFIGSGTDINGHFADFVFYRYGALQNNLPFFVYVQAFDDSHTANNRHLPSESELRFESFTKITGGAQGISYFVFDTNTVYPIALNALLDVQGNPSSLFEPAKQMNAEILNLGRSLRYVQTTEWRYVPGMTGSSQNPVPTHMIAFSPNPSIDPHMVAVNVNTANTANKGALKDGVIGWFEDDAGKSYFMLTNVFHGNGISAAASSVDFVIQFDNSVNSILRLNRLTGEPERIALSSNRLNLTLPGGTGDLFKYDDGMFAGIVLGDADLDGDVDLSDLSSLAAKYGTATGGRWSWGDFDLDGDIDLSDLSILASNYSAGEGQAYSDFESMQVPEPASSGILLLPAMLCGRIRRNPWKAHRGRLQ